VSHLNPTERKDNYSTKSKNNLRVDLFIYNLPENCVICLTTAFCGSEIRGPFTANEFEKWDTDRTACVEKKLADVLAPISTVFQMCQVIFLNQEKWKKWIKPFGYSSMAKWSIAEQF